MKKPKLREIVYKVKVIQQSNVRDDVWSWVCWTTTPKPTFFTVNRPIATSYTEEIEAEKANSISKSIGIAACRAVVEATPSD